MGDAESLTSSPRQVGVVIRTLNEAGFIGRCLDVLAGQQGPFELDVVVVDSGSSDGTVDIARAHGARIVEIPPGAFDYSRALNLGIRAATGDVIAILSAHAIPVDDRWLARMIAPLGDARVAGVASRQVPWPGAPYQERHRLRVTFDERRRVSTRTNGEVVPFSNAASCIRRSVWEAEPFTLPAAEDLDWARRVVAAGWTVVYEPAALVHHSHDESPRAVARRLIDINRGGLNSMRARPRGSTVREALSYLRHDGRLILGSDEPVPEKLVHARRLLTMVFYYLTDFSKPGSTAEFRRDELSPAGTAPF